MQEALAANGLSDPSIARITDAADEAIQNLRHGDLERWLAALNTLPPLSADHNQTAAWPLLVDLNSDTVAITVEADSADDHEGLIEFQQVTRAALEGLKPWRKGPYQIMDTFIDTEWRSDWKWQRIHSHLKPLAGRRVLDVGCGNGYHAWRMRGDGAAVVVGIDPSPLFMLQFRAVQHFVRDSLVQLLPLRLEALPKQLGCFDTVFSMGVLYHRRDYEAHLQELLGALRAGGELVLETLTLPGAAAELLNPAITPGPLVGGAGDQKQKLQNATVASSNFRYARMRNVWALPTESLLHQWLEQAGFSHCRTVNTDQTSTKEQRSTAWMPFESLQQALLPENPSLTIEGWPAPLRTTVVASK